MPEAYMTILFHVQKAEQQYDCISTFGRTHVSPVRLHHLLQSNYRGEDCDALFSEQVNNNVEILQLHRTIYSNT